MAGLKFSPSWSALDVGTMSGLQSSLTNGYQGGGRISSPSGTASPRSPMNRSAIYEDPHLQHEETQIRRRQEA